jgi:hypothetical protein
MAESHHEIFRGITAKVSRMDQPLLLQAMWECTPTSLSDGTPSPTWPLPERVCALYGALRFGCDLPGSDAPEWSMRPDDIFAAISLLILLVSSPDGDAAAQSPTRQRGTSEWPTAWPKALCVAADALYASAARQLILPPLMCDEMGTATQCFDAVFPPRLARDAQAVPEAEEPRTVLGAYSPEWAPSPRRTPPRAPHVDCAHEVHAPLPMGPLAREAERELSCLLDGAANAHGNTATMGSPTGGEETQWGTQAAGLYAMRDLDDQAEAETGDATSSHRDNLEQTARRARERQATAIALAAAHPPDSHFALQLTFLDLLKPWLPELPLETAILKHQAQLLLRS